MKCEVVLIAVLLGLGGCAHLDEPEDALAAQQETEAADLVRTSLRISTDAERLLSAQDTRLREIERRAPPPEAPAPQIEYPQIPATGSLVFKNFSMSMQEARIGQLLWIVAMEFGLGLSIDPAVLASEKTVNLFLKDITGRQALIHILQAFDVHGRVGEDNVLRVSLMEDRIFPVDALVVRGSMGLAAGGDALGAGGASTGLRDSVMFSGGVGDEKADVWSALGKTLETLLAEDEGGSTSAKKEGARFTIDRASSSVYVRARPSKIKVLAQMLENGRVFRSRQVQIDAQLLDVSLDNGEHVGINWASLGKRVMSNLGAPVTIGDAMGTVSAPPDMLGRSVTIPSQLMGVVGGAGGGGITLSNRVFSATINALKAYGQVKVLSNPSIRVNNGMPAYMSVGTNYRFVKEVSSKNSTEVAGLTPSMEVKTDSVFSGVVLGLGAVVKEGGEIELFVRPSQTHVENNSLALVEVGNGNMVTLPVVNTKSITTMLSIRDGDVVLLGGLIDQETSSGRQGLPGLSDMPGLGTLFRSSAESGRTRELVMVLRARIVQ